jgi:hypothetical protein
MNIVSLTLAVLKKKCAEVKLALQDTLAKKAAVVVHFACSTGGFYTSTPVQLARHYIPEWLKEQVRKQGKAKFVRCPGMHDMIQQGFLITAHSDIHIKATKFGVNVSMPVGVPENLQPRKMDYELVEGIIPIAANVKPEVWKISCPWGIHMPPGYSMHLLPPTFHANFFDKIAILPGTVDYDDFHTVNCIFVAIKECEFVIPMGTPLLHCLPFKREDFHAVSAKATTIQSDRHLYGFCTRVLGSYRRLFHKKKTYTIEVDK